MPNKSPLFTIITCTKNSAKYLPACLQSLSAQTFRDFEHLVVDGESTDQTLSLISKTSTLITLPPSGISAAMNEGIRRAHGQYLYFLHSDDALASPDVLAQVAQYLTLHPQQDWLYGQIHVVDAHDHSLGYFPRHRLFQLGSAYLLKFFNFIPHQAVFIHSRVFAHHGLFSSQYQSCMDYDYWLRIATSTRWHFFPHVIAHYRIHAQAQSSSAANVALTAHETSQIQQAVQNRCERLLSSIFNFLFLRSPHTTR